MPSTKIDYSALSNTDGEGQVVAPAYQYGADAHNIGNGNFQLTDPESWGQGLDNAGKFIVSAAASGLNGFYNSGVTVSNWLGSDVEQNDVATQLADLDDDLGAYYKENRKSVDLAGFIATSFIPGLGGIKLLNAGQKVLRTAQETGIIGGNLARVTGLLTPSSKVYTTLAAGEIAQANTAFSLTTGTALKAIGSGYAQAALESAAFEVAVSATTFKSPTLTDMDGTDIAKNIVLGTFVGGAIGGAISHAITYGEIKTGVKSFNAAEKQFADTSDLRGLTPAQQIIERTSRLDTLPNVPTADNILSGEFTPASKLLEGLTPQQQQTVANQLTARLGKLRLDTQTSLVQKNRESFHALTNNTDPYLANTVADLNTGLQGNQAFSNLESLTELGRVNSPLKAEIANNKIITAQAKNITDTLNLNSGEGLLPNKIGYLKLNGTGVGDVTFEKPTVLGLGDIYKSKEEVDKAIAGYGFTPNKTWSADITTHNEAEARYLWTDTAQLTDGIKIGEHDIPLLEKALADKLPTVNISSTSGDFLISNPAQLLSQIKQAKQEVANLRIAGTKTSPALTSEEIAKITNVKQSYLEGEISPNSAGDLFARQQAKSDYVSTLTKKGFTPTEIDTRVESLPYQPTYAKAAYDTSVLNSVDANQISGMAFIKSQQKLYQQGIDNVVANNVSPELFQRLWHPGDEMLLKTNRFGSGPGLVSFANGGYHTPESWAEAIGSTTAAIQKSIKDGTTDKLSGTLLKLASSQEKAVEFESINAKLLSTSENYALAEDGSGLIALKELDYRNAIANGKKVNPPILQEGAASTIPIKNQDVLEAWKVRTDITSARTQAFQDLRNAQGLTDIKDPRALRPVRQDPKDFPHFAVVVDESITGVGHKSMIHAATESALEGLISKVPSNYKVYTKGQLEDYFKANGKFDWEQTLHENYIDSDLKRNGVNNPFFIRTDPQKIAQSLLNDHVTSDNIFTRELINAKYEKEFSFLRQQGEAYTNVAASKYTGSVKQIENATNNPYLNYVKTALNVSQISEHPYLLGLNQKLDVGVSKAWNTISDAARATKSVEELEGVNKLLDEFGVKSAYYDAATELLANHTAPKGVLVNFVSKANAILSTLVTRLDPFNAINNAVGSTILYGSELKSFMSAVRADKSEIAGPLAGLLKTPRPSEALLNPQLAAGVENISTSGKVVQNAIKNWLNPESTNASGQNLRELYKANGWSTRLADQAKQLMEDLTLTGGESVNTINMQLGSAYKNFKSLVEKGETYTGNKYAEEMNRFISADSMRQITDVGVQAGKITEQEALGYINTFVNRTQGNILASQRPLIFQGAIGQAVGLFQSYQFNLIQQLFRHVSEGSGKDAATLLGLQGTMYGLNGLPGFNYLNTHILGTLSGNTDHTDAYSATYGIAGKSVGDLLLYGLPSNLLRANLYTRGDINPRQPTIIPVNPLDIPIVSSAMKFYDNVSTMVNRAQNGASLWQTLLQGIEHNGLSRPLAGIAQVAQAATHDGNVFSTTTKGSISGVNDLMSLATAARIAGGKPFDESVVNDQVFRITAYQAADRAKLDLLNQAVKATTIAGGVASPEQLGQFAKEYASLGGKTENFNKYMLMQIKNADTAKANKIIENLHSPLAQKMQQVMGGSMVLDGRRISVTQPETSPDR